MDKNWRKGKEETKKKKKGATKTEQNTSRFFSIKEEKILPSSHP